MDRDFAAKVGETFGTSDYSMKQELLAMLTRFEGTRQYRWQYLEYMTVDTWVDYDEEGQIAWDSYEKMRLFKEQLLGQECHICFAYNEFRGEYQNENPPNIATIESIFPWIEVWPADAHYWTKNVMNGIYNPVRRIPLT